MSEKHEKILEELKGKSILSMGGTEAVSVAYSVAHARQKAKGALKRILITVDSSIFKNGLNVLIPGSNERGLDLAAALGYVCGNAQDKLQLLSYYGEEQMDQAKRLLAQGKVSIKIKDDCDKLFIETLIESEGNIVRILILDFHLNIISEEIVTKLEELKEVDTRRVLNYIADKNLELKDFLEFVEETDEAELAFIDEGLQYNLALSQYKGGEGIADCFSKAMERYQVKEDMITFTQKLCMCACEARIGGAKLPVMTAAGSANYGIVVYLANYGVGSSMGMERDKILRAIALSNLVSMYANSYVGSISSICDCGFSVGIGVSVGVVYLLDGDLDAMERAVKNMLGSITGIICDGDKLKCAWKLGLATDWAIKSALLAMESEDLVSEGILDNTLEKILENISQIYNPIANTINQSIVDIIMGK